MLRTMKKMLLRTKKNFYVGIAIKLCFLLYTLYLTTIETCDNHCEKRSPSCGSLCQVDERFSLRPDLRFRRCSVLPALSESVTLYNRTCTWSFLTNHVWHFCYIVTNTIIYTYTRTHMRAYLACFRCTEATELLTRFILVYLFCSSLTYPAYDSRRLP